MINIPDTITYSSLVTRETVHIALTMAALHDLKVKAADVSNTYLIASNSKKIQKVLGPEIGENAGKSATIVRALYSLMSVGAFLEHIFTIYADVGV